jgi:DNA-binding NtrC family response regulator
VLTEAPWPGNVRELASAIERAVVFSTDEALAPEHLSPVPTGSAKALSWPSMDGAPWTLQRLNQTYTEWVLGQTGGDKQRAADILGVDLSTLYRWRRTKRD